MHLNSPKLILIFDSNLKILLFNDFVTHSEDFALDEKDIIDGIIFNITKIENLISNFISKHNLLHLATTIVLKDNLIVQTINQDLNLDPKIYHIKSYELQFYPASIFYNLGIKHYQIFQYSLLCNKLSLKLEAITTSLLHLYKLFKACSHKRIEANIRSIESLKLFLNHSIEESKLKNSICNTTKYFDTISKHINY
jgi:hypothetical protein